MGISVIIPIYNVAAYLPRCIESVLHQTYKELEIWLVDDGSQDESGQIADDYADQDSRIQVIHKENGGLSDARNAGMEKATKDYIFFLDSDDWITRDALEILLHTMEKEQADIVVGGLYYTYDDTQWIDNKGWKEGVFAYQYNNFQAMEALVEGTQLKNFAWGKLYKREMIQDLYFPKGLLFEDIFWQHQVFHRSQKCVVLRQPMVYYYQRSDSIVGTFKVKNLDRLKGFHERYHFIEVHYPSLILEMRYQLLGACLEYLVLLFLHRKQIKNKAYSQAICQYLKQNYSVFLACSKEDKEMQRNLKLVQINLYAMIGYRGIKKIWRKIRKATRVSTMVQVQQEKEVVS
ncbi:MAG: glycosyltransferase family 2 protein [Niameybacter sp.]|uniref:glycosyltransferase family 2 protein n=1 Tax=Niameybacter sp. TaxID=2033640 RepID=UPI002FC66751